MAADPRAQSAGSVEHDASRFFSDNLVHHTAHYPGHLFDRLREVSPAYQTASGVWLLTGFDVTAATLRDREAWSNQEAALETVRLNYEPGPATDLFLTRLGQSDGANHARMRKLLMPTFSGLAVEQWRRAIQEIAEELVTKAVGAGPIDVMRMIAKPLPQRFICGMLSLPIEDLPIFSQWADVLVNRKMVEGGGDTRKYHSEQMLAFADYLRGFIEERRRNPSDDLISQLVQAHDEGDRLTEDELTSLCQELIMGGVDTTANVIGSAFYSLIRSPGELDRLRAEPGLATTAAEEVLRQEPATFFSHPRTATRDMVLAGRTIPKGDKVIPLLAAANRDPAKFPDPHRFDIGRTPNTHLTFSFGPHFCVGNQIARMELVALLDQIAKRVSRIEFLGPEPRWKDHMRLHGLSELNVSLH